MATQSQRRKVLVAGAAVNVVYRVIDCIFNESDGSSDTDTDDLNESVEFQKMTRRAFIQKQPPNRIRDFVSRIVPHYTDKEFQSHFRVTRETFDRLLTLLGPALSNNSELGGRPTIEPQKQLLAVIWLLATPECYRSVGSRFDLAKSSLFHCFRRVVQALNDVAKNVIRWPHDRREYNTEQFKNMSGIPNIVGIIDGTYVKIKAPMETPELYINRKCFHGITLQGMCDPMLKFIDCFVGFPSSVSDIRIFRNSPLYSEFMNETNHYFPNGEYILGDKAYPLTTWCIPPYIARRPLNEVQRYFNTKHAQTRQCIERTFALLFGRFRRLRDLDMTLVDFIPATILACCVLHNVCLEFRDDDMEMYIEEGRAFLNPNNERNEEQQVIRANNLQANIKRDNIAENLFRGRRRNV